MISITDILPAGWIKVPGIRIDYPVLRGSRWNEYLHKDYKREYCYDGSIFLQPETSFEDKHLILYELSNYKWME